MREILFRGKRKDNGEWVYGFLCKTYSHIPPRTRDAIMHENLPPLPAYSCAEINIATVGQYTGLIDKNGTRIFEGDILKCSYGTTCVVEWDKENARFLGFNIGKKGYISYVGREPKSEVIGNIHDNPELLEGGAE